MLREQITVLCNGHWQWAACLAYPSRSRRIGSFQEFLDRVTAGDLSSDELVRRYYTHVHRREGNYRAAVNVLGVDWRTVRDKVDRTLSVDESR